MKRSLRVSVLLIAALALLNGCGSTLQPTAPTLAPAPTIAPAPTVAPAPAAPDTAARLDALFSDLAANDRFSGAVLVVRGDEVLLRKGYGYADREARIPNTPDTVFRIGNLTQPLTAAAILLLEAQGKLSVQDSICAYLDSCPAAWEPVTLHHLLSNTSGIVSYWAKDKTTAHAPEELIALVRDRPLKFTPGSRWDIELGQTNYALLGMVIERISGQPYGVFMEQQVFDPLGMTATGYSEQPENQATGYLYSKKPAPPFDPSLAYAGYGLYSTVGDLYLWDRALFEGKLLPAAQRQKMLTSYSSPDDDEWGFGYGTLRSDERFPGHEVVALGVGWSVYPGFWAANWSLTDLGITVVTLANRQNNTQEDVVSDAVASTILEEP